MTEAPQAYPLQWPAGKPRTSSHKRVDGKFKSKGSGWTTDYATGQNRYDPAKPITVAVAISRVQAELDRLGARLPVISSNLKLQRNGLPYSQQNRVDDPGVAVYFRLKDKPIVLACDRYKTAADNIAAIAAHIDAMRAMERHGVGSLEQMFAGFAALPPAMNPDDWRTVLGNPGSLAEAEMTYREYMKMHHPDLGGDTTQAAIWNAAIAKAREHFVHG